MHPRHVLRLWLRPTIVGGMSGSSSRRRQEPAVRLGYLSVHETGVELVRGLLRVVWLGAVCARGLGVAAGDGRDLGGAILRVVQNWTAQGLVGGSIEEIIDILVLSLHTNKRRGQFRTQRDLAKPQPD